MLRKCTFSLDEVTERKLKEMAVKTDRKMSVIMRRLINAEYARSFDPSNTTPTSADQQAAPTTPAA